VLIAAMLFAFLVTSALTIDFAYMQLIRTELRTATDSAAKAGAEALARTQNSTQAVAAARQYASMNKVAGRSFQIANSDVQLGRVTAGTNGAWGFANGATPFNAVRVNSRIANGASTSSIPTFFGPAFGHSGFSTSLQATAGQQEVEVCLCLDRSGSMELNLTGNRTYNRPLPANSRWGTLSTAVDAFLDEVATHTFPPRTSVVTWSSNVTTNVALPSDVGYSWTTNRTNVENAVDGITRSGCSGTTWLASGLDRAVSVLTGTNSKPLSSKIVVLLTDGEWNGGRNPALAATDAANARVVVYTVSMATTSQSILQTIATTTKGQYFATFTSEQLQAAFRQIAQNLPIVLTD
jgi:hypothetical protein